MFTGIIQCEGDVVSVRREGTERRFRIRPHEPFDGLTDGESIAVSGVCLSVEAHEQDCFTAYASGETVARTTLGELAPGGRVNLERALALGERLGGHIVSGHVDCVAVVKGVERRGESLCCRLDFPAAYGREVIPKGSVALDGISLTINACGANFLEVNVIPDTRRRTTMRAWRPGSRVNMETDLVGKYVAHMLGPWSRREGAAAPPARGGGLSLASLREAGFL
ncbi:riboflavin synthase [Desulfovibrio sp.]|uniref:riboflavin synthase n=1 Tax=Desulfovibrio sp. TaxID=885 RepID=UPI0023D49127|nr:riboflavin synthase [Desulfovibrio sp.]MDE7240565.1 riboflavin synthase [Desulfovibrio sp.]